jgi:ankyrin repeat protein
VNEADSEGSTPLFFAAQNGHVAVVEVLLARGVNVNQADSEGTTPLFIAAQNGLLAVVEVLLVAGADVEHGLLHIDLHRIVPDAVVQTIRIGRK